VVLSRSNFTWADGFSAAEQKNPPTFGNGAFSLDPLPRLPCNGVKRRRLCSKSFHLLYSNGATASIFFLSRQEARRFVLRGPRWQARPFVNDNVPDGGHIAASYCLFGICLTTGPPPDMLDKLGVYELLGCFLQSWPFGDQTHLFFLGSSYALYISELTGLQLLSYSVSPPAGW